MGRLGWLTPLFILRPESCGARRPEWGWDTVERMSFVHSCDVLIAGGSTAALSAALTAAEVNSTIEVCVTEPTDTLGGQLAFNPAIDYGKNPPVTGREWGDMISNISDPDSACWVSKSCFPPLRLQHWIDQRLASLPNLQPILRTTVHGAVRDQATGRVLGLELITRTPRSTKTEWAALLSESIKDWYSPMNSVNFTKQVRTVNAEVVVEASELGDVLATARLPYTQGVEIPTESSLATDDGVSQSAVFTFFMELLPNASAVPDPAPVGNSWVSSGAAEYWGAAPEGACCCGGSNARKPDNNTCHGHPLSGTCIWGGQCSWAGVWQYRRSTKGHSPTPIQGLDVGDVSLQNWGHGNDMEAACLFVPVSAANMSVSAGEWSGGVNLTALGMAEDRAFGWFHTMATETGGRPSQVARAAVARAAPPTVDPRRFVLNRQYSGTTTGLVKFPYIRDTKRVARGLNGFRMTHEMMMANQSRSTGPIFHDAVGVGNYNFDVKPGAGYGAANGGKRKLPSYMWNFTTNTGLAGHAAPFYFPFRALTVEGAPNVLTAGKTLAMTYAANTAARVHSNEWRSGVAAGAAASIMVKYNWSSAQMYESVDELQKVSSIARPSYLVLICPPSRCFAPQLSSSPSHGLPHPRRIRHQYLRSRSSAVPIVASSPTVTHQPLRQAPTRTVLASPAGTLYAVH
jgi:hypothetical protein